MAAAMTFCSSATLAEKNILQIVLELVIIEFFTSTCTGKFNRNVRSGRSHIFRLRLRFCSKIFEFGFAFENFSKVKIQFLFRLGLPSMQLKFRNVFT